MTAGELTVFLEANQNIEWLDDFNNQQILFRNTNLAWYQNNEQRSTGVEYRKLNEMDADALLKAINQGLEVENITRITGYFTKVSSWNPGKKAELKDRNRMNLSGSVQSMHIPHLKDAVA